MKIATWNVDMYNREPMEGLRHLFSHDPDVVTLQELPYKALVWTIKNYPNYYYKYTFDYMHKKLGKTPFICLLSKLPVTNSGELEYSTNSHHTFYSDFLWKNLGLTEVHVSPFLSVKFKKYDFRFYGVRLSSAINLSTRDFFLRKFPRAHQDGGFNFILGDLNITRRNIYRITTGLLRGMSFRELFKDERKMFDSTISDMGYNNIFEREITTSIPGLGDQLDHILIPKDFKKHTIKLSDESFGSDHKILFADLAI